MTTGYIIDINHRGCHRGHRDHGGHRDQCDESWPTKRAKVVVQVLVLSRVGSTRRLEGRFTVSRYIPPSPNEGRASIPSDYVDDRPSSRTHSPPPDSRGPGGLQFACRRRRRVFAGAGCMEVMASPRGSCPHPQRSRAPLNCCSVYCSDVLTGRGPSRGQETHSQWATAPRKF
jgi:hypothetical protein